MIRFYNTRTGSLEDFTSLAPAKATLYTCGPTVYSEPLIGNWIAYLRWDLLVRTLRANNYDVTRVMNITDVGHLVSDGDEGEDKMEKGARREGTTAWEVADRYTNQFLEGMTAFNMLPPEVLSKATEHIPDQIALIQQLESAGHTYVIDDGVYFDTTTFPAYANFAKLDLDAMKAGARVEFNTEKRHPSDFALWKLSPAGVTRDMEWDSPWGRGFPGWHIECSAMALRYLGETIDIHTGGIDHIPVHHTNEIAQSEAATGKRFANYWLHANFLLVDGTKISKSLDNGYTLNDLANHGFSPMDFRMFALQSHYRTESNFTWENLAGAANRLKRWKAVACLRHQTANVQSDTASEANAQIMTAIQDGLEALNHDLNSPRALTVFEKVFDALEQEAPTRLDHPALNHLFQFIDDSLGLKLLETTPDLTDTQKKIILERAQARAAGQWDLSDKLRDQLLKESIGLNDTPDGTRWYWL